MSKRKIQRTWTEEVQSIFGLFPEIASKQEEALKRITNIVGILVENVDNNTYTVINAGTPGIDEEFNYYPIGKMMENENGAVDDFIHYGTIPSGTIFCSVKRKLLRNEDIEDPVTEGLPEEYAHKVNFILVDKTLKKFLSAYDVAQMCSETSLIDLERRLSKRYHIQ